MSFENVDSSIIDGKSSSSDCDLSEKSIQSPTVSFIQSDSSNQSSNPNSSSSNSKNCENMKKELQEALEKISKLEELLKQKDERIKLLEEEHARHQIICNPELHSGLYGRKLTRRAQPRRTATKRRKISSNQSKEFNFEEKPDPIKQLSSHEKYIPPIQEMKSEEFEVLKSEIKRTHRRARPFDLINEPPPKTTIECSIGLFTTQQEYYRNFYVRHEDLDGPELFGPNSSSKPIIPNWRLNDISETDSDMSATSDDSSDDHVEMTHSDDTYAKRHQKYEIEEKRLVRKDKLMKETRQKSRPEQFKTFHPYPGDFSTLEITPALPITLWGHSLPNIKNSTFSLPWFTTSEKVKPKKV